MKAIAPISIMICLAIISLICISKGAIGTLAACWVFTMGFLGFVGKANKREQHQWLMAIMEEEKSDMYQSIIDSVKK